MLLDDQGNMLDRVSNILQNIPDIYEMKEGAEGYWEKRNKRDWINVIAHYI